MKFGFSLVTRGPAATSENAGDVFYGKIFSVKAFKTVI